MNTQDVVPAVLDPFPPYAGLDNGYSGSGMYSDSGEVVSVAGANDPISEVSSHAFKISSVEDDGVWTATVAAGKGSYADLTADGAGEVMASMKQFQFASITQDSITTTTGFFLKWSSSWQSVSSSDNPAGFGDTWGQPNMSSPTIVASSNTTVDQMTSETTGFAYMRIGVLTITGGVASITQDLDGNVALSKPVFLLSASVVSGQEFNGITASAEDNLAYYAPLFTEVGEGLSVSTDAVTEVQSLENTGVLSITGSAGITASPSTGSVTISIPTP